MVNQDRKQAAEAAIAEHLRVVGLRDLSRVRERFPNVPEGTRWHWVRGVKRVPPEPEAVRAARRRLQRAGLMLWLWRSFPSRTIRRRWRRNRICSATGPFSTHGAALRRR